MGIEKRHGRRFEVLWAAYIGHPTCGVVLGKVVSASVSGLGLVSPLRYPMQDHVTVQIEISPIETIRCVGRITREQESARGKYAYGLRLVRFAGDGQKIYTAKLLDIRHQELAKKAAA